MVEVSLLVSEMGYSFVLVPSYHAIMALSLIGVVGAWLAPTTGKPFVEF